MKHMNRYTILALFFILFTAVSIPLKGEAQPPLKVSIFLPSPEVLPKWGAQVLKNIHQMSLSGKMKVIVYQIGWKASQIRFLIDLIKEQEPQVIIADFPVYISQSVFSELRNRKVIFIYPVFDKQIIEFAEKYKSNFYVIPESIDEILLTIDKSVRKFGPSDINNLVITLERKAQDAVKKAESYQNEISAKVTEAIAKWGKKRSINTAEKFVNFQKEDYSSKLFSYIIRVPGRKETFPALLQGVSPEMTKVLDQYVKYENAKGLKVSRVELAPFLASGVNGCSVLPCKKYCCDYYKDSNVDDCFKAMGCK